MSGLEKEETTPNSVENDIPRLSEIEAAIIQMNTTKKQESEEMENEGVQAKKFCIVSQQ